MNEVRPMGVWKCAAICGAGCLACVADHVIVILDATTGATALASGTAQ